MPKIEAKYQILLEEIEKERSSLHTSLEKKSIVNRSILESVSSLTKGEAGIAYVSRNLTLALEELKKKESEYLNMVSIVESRMRDFISVVGRE